MSDWKRFAVWIGVIAWCFFSLAFDARAQGTIALSPLPEFTEQRCSESVLAANTIIIKKKAVVSVPAGAPPDGANQWFYVVDDSPPSSDNWLTTYLIGGPITITTGGTITKVAVYSTGQFVLSGTAIIRVQLWKNTGSWTRHECIEIPIEHGAPAGWFEATLVTSLAVGNGDTVRVVGISSDATVLYYYDGTSGGYYDASSYDNGCTDNPTWTNDYATAFAVYVD